jgi:hypothetical protein
MMMMIYLKDLAPAISVHILLSFLINHVLVEQHKPRLDAILCSLSKMFLFYFGVYMFYCSI